MTASTKDTFVIYHEQFHAGFTETLVQETQVFNEASRGAIRLVTMNKLGDYEKSSFFATISGLVTRRDISSLASASDLDLTQAELVSVKLNRMIGPVVKTLDALKKIGSSREEMSFVLGQQWAKAVLIDQVNSAIRALVNALGAQATNVYDYSGTGTMTHAALATGKGKLGDAASRIVCWIMHSKVATDLEVQAITDKITNVADGVINFGRVGALGLPVLITDSAPLLVSGTPDQYVTLGLVPDGAVVTESEERTIALEGPITGKANLFYRLQGEIAYNLGLKGFAWDVANGGANPVDADVATASNWDKVATSYKDLAGVYIYTD